MAKLEATLHGNFSAILNAIDTAVLEGSFTASLEDESHFQSSSGRCVLRVYERYSCLGSNRVSASVTLVGDGQRIYLTIITSGGSEAVYVKMNTFGEKSFLKQIQEVVERFENRGT